MSTKKKLNTLLESVREDKWKVLNKKPNDFFRVHNPRKGMTVYCKKLRIDGDWEYWCYINQGIKKKVLEPDQARKWANQIMYKIGGQQVVKIEKRKSVDNEIDDENVFDELSSILSGVKNFMKKWGVGYNVKSLKTEPGATKKVRDVIAKNIAKDNVSSSELKKDITDSIQKYKDGKPNVPTWQINRIARSEANEIRNISKLIKYKKQGFEFVKHVAMLDARTGEDSRAFNGSVFEIDWLFKNPNYRLNLRPNDRCTYVPSRGPQKINPKAHQWVRENKR